MSTDDLLIDHLETYLGPIQRGWRLSPDGGSFPFGVVHCSGGIEGTEVFCTFGLGNHAFKESLNQAGQPIRHELLIAVPESFIPENVPALLQQLGDLSLTRHKAFLRGEVIRENGLVFSDLKFRGFYVSEPVFIEDDDFGAYERQDGQSVIFAWMIPVLQEEIDFIRTHGWNCFENRMLERNLDPVELVRESAVNEEDDLNAYCD